MMMQKMKHALKALFALVDKADPAPALPAAPDLSAPRDCTGEAICRIRMIFAEVFWSDLRIIGRRTRAGMLRSAVVAEQVPGPAR